MRVRGHCQGFICGTVNKGHKFVLQQTKATKKRPRSVTYIEPEDDAELEALQEDDPDAPICLVRDSLYIALGNWQLPTYSPWVFYTISIDTCVDSIWRIRAVYVAERRFPKGVPKSVIVDYVDNVTHYYIPKTEKRALKAKIQTEMDLADTGLIAIEHLIYLRGLLAIQFKPDVFYRLLLYFNAQFLMRYTESQWGLMSMLIENGEGYVFCFKSLFVQHFHKNSRYTDAFLESESTGWLKNSIEWLNRHVPIRYHHQFALWDISRLRQSESCDEKLIDIVEAAFAIYREYENSLNVRGSTYLLREPWDPQSDPAVDFLLEHKILAGYSPTLRQICLADPIDYRYERATARAVKALKAIRLIQLDTYVDKLADQISTLTQTISMMHNGVSVVLGEGRLTAGLLYLTSGITVVTMESTQEYSNSASAVASVMQTGSQKRSREEQRAVQRSWKTCTHLIVAKASRITVKSFYEALRKIRAPSTLPHPMLLDDDIDDPERYASLGALEVIMLGDVGEQVLNHLGDSGGSSLLFHAIAQSHAPLDESREANTIRRMRDIITHCNTSTGVIPVADVHAMSQNIRDWARKFSRRDKPTTQVFCSSNASKRAIMTDFKAHTDTLYDARTFSIGDFVVVTNLGVLGFIKSARQKCIELDGQTAWKRVDIKHNIKTYSEEYILDIENSPQSISSTATTSSTNSNMINGGARNNRILTSQHPRTLKHAYVLLPQEFIGYPVEYVFFYVDAYTTATDIITAHKYATQQIIFFLAPEVVSLDTLQSKIRALPRSLLFYDL